MPQVTLVIGLSSTINRSSSRHTCWHLTRPSTYAFRMERVPWNRAQSPAAVDADDDDDQVGHGDELTRVSALLRFAIPRATRETLINPYSETSEIHFEKIEHHQDQAIYLYHNDINETIGLYRYKEVNCTCVLWLREDLSIGRMITKTKTYLRLWMSLVRGMGDVVGRVARCCLITRTSLSSFETTKSRLSRDVTLAVRTCIRSQTHLNRSSSPILFFDLFLRQILFRHEFFDFSEQTVMQRSARIFIFRTQRRNLPQTCSCFSSTCCWWFWCWWCSCCCFTCSPGSGEDF